MIRINLAKVRKEEGKRGIAFDLSSLKTLKVQDLLKAGGEYYVGLLLWLGVVGILAYYWKVKAEVDSLKAELDNLNAEKTRLQAQAEKFLNEKKAIEERIARIKKGIQDIESSKDIIIGLKAYYEPFNSGFFLYTSRVPRASWISSYTQSLNINQGKLTSELEISSLDYESLSLYSKALSNASQGVYFSQLERKVNPHGFEYYSAKLSSEKSLQEGR
ncbi:septum formation initiator family protein [Hydrogenobacter sp. T-2]|uniref:septum formation initiator family protein n=1 Tax=Pampinifervens diazotrophicum TaxID=1632018 RepID=UPI002B25A310|nr:septum formation initiator family protein [Hydrogenobacter sp. T-2]WPM32740.1 septum formation initiator family protein [Hydrogenobacter sp. T-2]